MWKSLVKFSLLTVWIVLVSVTAVTHYQPSLHVKSDAVYECVRKLNEIGFSDFREDTIGIVVSTRYADSLVSFVLKSDYNHIQCYVHNQSGDVGWIMHKLETLFYKNY